MRFPSDLLTGLPPVWLLVTSGVLITAEVGTLIGVVLPGVTAVLALGYLCSSGTVDPVTAGVVAIGCEIGGGHLAYARGRYARSTRTSGKIRRRVKTVVDKHFSRSSSWSRSIELRAMGLMERRGAWAIVLCQWFAGVRTVTPRLVGSAGMSYRRFALAQVPSAALWVCTWMSAGAVAGATYERIATTISVVGLAVLAVILLAVSMWATVRRRQGSGHRRRSDVARHDSRDTPP
ncbi:DedA family protein [Rhodococcus erythropolis]|uniref:DedA family protein n=1 Tax=Rhodococcus erythropolis TaxID=1833 RepID=UPI001BE4E273|nr:DedA family protein [Rhodococcus erythropolis]MBT2269502.1 DedA family protein [Rhodococcus erythropolis]